jgi:hypothetical protein
MADMDSHSIEECLVVSVWVQRQPHTGQTTQQVIAAFEQQFGKATLFSWKKCVFSMESVKYSPRSRHPLSGTTACAGAATPIKCLRHKSIQKQTVDVGVPSSIMFDHMNDLVMTAFWPMFID